LSEDIALLLHGWDYNANEVTVRKIVGVDGREKIQMRLDLGVLQMEVEGRPDGMRPHGRESLLEYQEERLQRFEERHGIREGFELTAEECADLKQEAMQYYYRYLSLFPLTDYTGVGAAPAANVALFI